MGLFGKRKEDRIILPKGAKCCRCGRKIKEGQRFMYIDCKLYCEKCGNAKKDWDLLELMMILDDD